MVDLRDALRPFVDEAAGATRRPVAEIAERADRARRRRVRRRSAVAGLAVVVVAVTAVAGLLDSRRPPDDVSTVEPAASTSSTSSTSVPATADTRPVAPSTAVPSTSATTAPAPTPASTLPPSTEPAAEPPSSEPLVSLVDGVEATSRTTSSWEDGHCVEVRIENTTGSPAVWKVRYALGGTINTLWNAAADDRTKRTVVFTGDTFNRELAPGAWTTFGTCIDT